MLKLKINSGNCTMLINLHLVSYTIDGNNLYGPSLMQHLPTEILDLVNPKDFNLDNYHSDSLINCFGEVALDYPDEGHDMHTD